MKKKKRKQIALLRKYMAKYPDVVAEIQSGSPPYLSSWGSTPGTSSAAGGEMGNWSVGQVQVRYPLGTKLSYRLNMQRELGRSGLL